MKGKNMTNKQSAPPALRNRELIAEILAEELPASGPDVGMVLEVASGTGEHALLFAERFRDLTWQPSDPDQAARASIDEWRGEAGLPNLLPVMELDAASAEWPIDTAAAILCINMVHISPIAATEGLMAAAGVLLGPNAPLILYGPYIEEGVETVPSNFGFDASLRSRDPQWGLRHTGWMDQLAQQNGLTRARRIAMPANNIMLIYRKG